MATGQIRAKSTLSPQWQELTGGRMVCADHAQDTGHLFHVPFLLLKANFRRLFILFSLSGARDSNSTLDTSCATNNPASNHFPRKAADEAAELQHYFYCFESASQIWISCFKTSL